MAQPGTLEKVGHETMAIVKAGEYVAPSGARVELRAAADAAVVGTRLWREAELDALVAKKPAPQSQRAQLFCWTERSGRCVQRLVEAGATHVGLLNYANGVKPGGGFLHGAPAQEEALCRCSALYACLASGRDDARAYYEVNKAANSALVTGAALVSPRVPFFRAEQFELLDAPFSATVITCAAPDLGWLFASTSEGLEPKSRFDDVPAVFARRTQYVLAAAHAQGCDAVVIGPWGCGAFGNDAEIVAEAFSAAVRHYADAFDAIVFSTFGPPQNREAFERRFKKNFAWDVG